MKNQDKFSSWVFESQGKPVEKHLLPGLLLTCLSLGGNGLIRASRKELERKTSLLNNCSCLFSFGLPC